MQTSWSRRSFVRGLTAGAAGFGAGLGPFYRGRAAESSRVALVKGTDRRKNLLKALEMIEDDVRSRLGNRQVVIKPNCTRVEKENQLASTHVDNLWALCEFFSTFYSGKIIVAEGVGSAGPLDDALKNFGYLALRDRYNVEFFDLLTDDYTTTYIIDTDFKPVPIRVSKFLQRPDNYIVSAAVLKTHSLAVVTLGLKNLLLASAMNFNKRGDANGVKTNDRRLMHAGTVAENPRPMNYNLFRRAQQLTPDLVTIDGFIGMEGNGPIHGTGRESNLAVAGTDWLAADRVGVELMGLDFNRIGHYRYAAESGMGEADLQKIRVVGDSIGNLRQHYRPPDDINGIVL